VKSYPELRFYGIIGINGDVDGAVDVGEVYFMRFLMLAQKKLKICQ
jgi:hypothetical protein